MSAGPAGPGQLTPLPSPPRSSPARTRTAMSNQSEEIGMMEEEELSAEVTSMEQDNETGNYDTITTSEAGPSATTTSQPLNSRRSGRANPSTTSRSRGASSSNKTSFRGPSAFEREAAAIERRDGRGGGGGGRQDGEGRQGAEQNIWDKVLDKNGYLGQINFDPFQELNDQRNSHQASSKLPTDSANTLASPSPA